MTLEELEALEAKRSRHDAAVKFLDNYSGEHQDFRKNGDARYALSDYREALRVAAPELIRYAKIGVLLKLSKSIGPDGSFPKSDVVDEACLTYEEIMGMKLPC